jgi:hypothetical protein
MCVVEVPFPMSRTGRQMGRIVLVCVRVAIATQLLSPLQSQPALKQSPADR